MPKLIPKVPVIIKKPEHRGEALKQFVNEQQYDAVKKAVDKLVHAGVDLTLRKIWASLDHMIAVNDGRETEVYLAEVIEDAEQRQQAAKITPGSKKHPTKHLH